MSNKEVPPLLFRILIWTCFLIGFGLLVAFTVYAIVVAWQSLI